MRVCDAGRGVNICAGMCGYVRVCDGTWFKHMCGYVMGYVICDGTWCKYMSGYIMGRGVNACAGICGFVMGHGYYMRVH